MQDIDIAKLKNDPEFKKNLEKLALEAKEQESVSKAYGVLDASLLIEEENENIDALFAQVLQISFDDLANKLTLNQKFDINDEEDLARLRAIYEHGIEKYSSGDYTGAKEIFLVLYYMFEDEKQMAKAMQVHIVAAASEVDFDTFFENYTDPQAITEDTTKFAHFIKHFSMDSDAFLEKNSVVLEDALRELDGLKE